MLILVIDKRMGISNARPALQTMFVLLLSSPPSPPNFSLCIHLSVIGPKSYTEKGVWNQSK